MKKITSIFKRIPKSLVAVFAMLAAVLIPVAIMAWGPDRPTFTMAKPASYVTFNSITDNSLEGDERNFVRIHEVSEANNVWHDTITVEEGKEYMVRIYVHNNAASNLNLVATNVRASFGLSNEYGNSFTMNGFVSSDNANPTKIWDQIVVQGEKQFKLNYVAGSAKYYNNAVGSAGVALGNDLFTTEGALLGWETMNGQIPGCMEYSGYVLFRIKPEFKPETPENPNFTIDKKVRVQGQTEWKDNVTANPGDTLEYRIEYKNTGDTTLTNVIVKDTLPAGVSYIDGSTKLWNANNPNGTSVADGVTTTGINIGNYTAGSNAIVRFSAKVADNEVLPKCGDNVLKNVASAKPDGQDPKEDDATTTVPKECELPEPVIFECEALTADRNKITKGETVNFTVKPKFTGENVSVKEYKMDFGDTQTQIKDIAQFAHNYDRAGNYVAQAWVTYNVDGKTETVTSEACKKPIEVTETPITEEPCIYDPSLKADDPNCVPSYIPATGNGAAAGGIIGAGALTLGIASWLSSRRVLRSLK